MLIMAAVVHSEFCSGSYTVDELLQITISLDRIHSWLSLLEASLDSISPGRRVEYRDSLSSTLVVGTLGRFDEDCELEAAFRVFFLLFRVCYATLASESIATCVIA
jgi:hypothetical protein